VIDSLPIAVCDNIRIRRSKISTDEKFRGYKASKKRYFYGLNIHLLVTQDGQPVECLLTHGGCGDVDALKYYAYELPDGAIIYAEKADNAYEIEDLLKEVEHRALMPIRQKNSKRALPPEVSLVQQYYRLDSCVLAEEQWASSRQDWLLLGEQIAKNLFHPLPELEVLVRIQD
jgi:hypothetical protein